jgi:transcriptional regulator with XRE-family HTH domain
MSSAAAGTLLREWRTRRRFSQLDLAVTAEVSAKHLSYIETGRSTPSPEMIVHLCEHLDVPLRRRNDILLAAGFAPRYSNSVFDPTVASDLRAAVEQIVSSHTFPAVVVDSDWHLVTANAAAFALLDGVAEHLLQSPSNVIRLSLHPDGLAGRIANFDDYARHILSRARRAVDHAPSAVLEALLDEFAHLATPGPTVGSGILLPLELTTTAGLVRLFSTITTFGSPRDATLEELAIETFYPADPESQHRLTELTAAVTV